MNFLFFFALCAPVPNGNPDGAIVLLRDSNAIVTHITQSRWTHMGIVFKEQGQLWVFEASPGRVRKVSLSEFTRDAYARRLGYNSRSVVYIMPPRTPFADAELAAMRSFAHRQVGRRYSIKGILRDRPVEGTNCAQFVAATLQQSGRIRFPHTFDQTPEKVLDRSKHLYAELFRVTAPANHSDHPWLDATGRTFQDTREWLKWTTWEMFHYWRD